MLAKKKPEEPKLEIANAASLQPCKVDLEFTGSGMSTVLQFLKPLIQSALNKRLTASRHAACAFGLVTTILFASCYYFMMMIMIIVIMSSRSFLWTLALQALICTNVDSVINSKGPHFSS